MIQSKNKALFWALLGLALLFYGAACVYTLRLSSSGGVALRDSPSVTYRNTLIGLALGRLPGNLKSFEYG